jgi:hypothetical protein
MIPTTQDVSGDTPKVMQQFMKRLKRAQGIADLWMGLHQACYFYAIPNRNKFWRPKEQQGELRGARVYDTTAIDGTNTFVSKMHLAMTPPQTQWGYLNIDPDWKLDNPELVEEAQLQLDDYMRKLFEFIHDSNFDVVINECYYDLGVGTACLVINSLSLDVPLLFTSIPMDKLAIEEAMTGKIESWYRNWEDVKINEIKVRWPKAKLPAEYLKDLAQDNQATVALIYEGVMYRPENAKKYCYVVCAQNHLLYYEDFEFNPGIVWRFRKTNNDVFGRGPIMDALPSIISLNEMARIELASANLNTFKPYMGFSDSVFNPHTFKIEPMTVIPIAQIGSQGQVPLIPLPDTSNPQFAQLTIMDLRMQIKTLLFADSPIPQDGKQPVSATELMISTQMLAERIGPNFSRLQHEFILPTLQNCAFILNKTGLLPFPVIQGPNGKAKISFKYISPLALAKGQEQVSRFTQWFQIIQGVSGPEQAQLFINSGKYPWILANLMQLDLNLLNSPEGVQSVAQQMLDQGNEMQDQMMEAQENQTPPPTQ